MNQISCGRCAPLVMEDEERNGGKQHKLPLPFIVKHAARLHLKSPQVILARESDWILVTHKKQSRNVGSVRLLTRMMK